MSTQTPTVDPATGRYTWFGYLADDNVEHIAQRIENLLATRRYTFVSHNADQPRTHPEVRTSQRLTPEKHIDKRSPDIHRLGDTFPWGPSRSCGITCADTYGVWGMHSTYATEAEATDAAHDPATVKRTTYIVIAGGRAPDDLGRHSKIEVTQYNGHGEVLHWVIAPEADTP